MNRPHELIKKVKDSLLQLADKFRDNPKLVKRVDDILVEQPDVVELDYSDLIDTSK